MYLKIQYDGGFAMQAEEYVKHLYDETTDGFIQVLRLDESEIRILNTDYNGLREIIELTEGNTDCFITPNTMYRKQRRINNIRQFRALYQDLDFSKLGYSIDETVYQVYILAYERKIPIPTMVVSSGRGIHVYWKITNAPYGAIQTYQELQDYLWFKLKGLGADNRSIDGARVLRLPGTFNSRNMEMCKVLSIDKSIEYSMFELREEFLNYRGKNFSKESNKDKVYNKVVKNRFFNSYSLHLARSEDLETIVKLRKGNMNGYRNMTLHCYAYWIGIYIRDSKSLEEEVKSFNSTFNEPLKDCEVDAILRCVPKAIDKFIDYEQGLRDGKCKRVSKGMRDKGGYWYKNETLIDRLGITIDEQRHLKTIIGVEEKYSRRRDKDREYQRSKRRNQEGLTSREQSKKDRINHIQLLKQRGLTQKQVSENIGVSLRTVKSYWNI